MTFVKEHIKDCEKYLGEPYEEVHKWFDEFSKLFQPSVFNDYHRTFRHNSYGLTCIKGMWGKEAELAGRIHLVRDYLEGPIPNENILQKYINGKHFNKMMKFWNNPMNMELEFHSDILNAWIKEGLGLVALSTGDLVTYDNR